MNRIFVGFIVALVLGVFSFNVHATTTVDLKKSAFHWKATKKLSGGHWGDILLKSANVYFKEGQFSNAEFVMDMDSFTVDNLEGKREKRFIGHVKSADFFEVEKYPTAKLTLENQTSENIVTGTLTIKNQIHPVEVRFNKKGNIYSGTFIFDRTKYGVVYGSGNFFKELVVDKIINDEVTINFNVLLNKD